MKTGAEPKKVAILAGLLIVAGVVLYFNVFAGDSGSPTTPRPVAAVAPPPVIAAPVVTATPGRAVARDDHRRSKNNALVGEFKLRQGVEPGADKPDPATID